MGMRALMYAALFPMVLQAPVPAPRPPLVPTPPAQPDLTTRVRDLELQAIDLRNRLTEAEARIDALEAEAEAGVP